MDARSEPAFGVLRVQSRLGRGEAILTCVRIFEILYPGTWLQGIDGGDTAMQVTSLLHVLESHLADAAVGLAMFEEARARPYAPPALGGADSDVRRLVELGMGVERHWRAQAQEQPETPEEQRASSEQIRFEAGRLVSRLRQEVGHVPAEYQHRLPFIHAHTVLYALDGVSKVLRRLTQMPGLPDGVSLASRTFASKLPSVVEIRNSAHHLEDRARGLGRNGKPLELRAIDNNIAKAPGGILLLSALNGNRLGYTLNDGFYGEVEVSEGSVDVARSAIQQAIDSFEWRGPRRAAPY